VPERVDNSVRRRAKAGLALLIAAALAALTGCALVPCSPVTCVDGVCGTCGCPGGPVFDPGPAPPPPDRVPVARAELPVELTDEPEATTAADDDEARAESSQQVAY
jgi:hypothetical protein